MLDRVLIDEKAKTVLFKKGSMHQFKKQTSMISPSAAVDPRSDTIPPIDEEEEIAVGKDAAEEAATKTPSSNLPSNQAVEENSSSKELQQQ